MSRMSDNYMAQLHARRSDPDTSHEAARHAEQFVGNHCGRILAWLRTHPEGGTKDEIAAGTGLRDTAVARRIKDLRDLDLVEDSGEQRVLGTGRSGTVWRAR